MNACAVMAGRKAAALLAATVGKASRPNPVTPGRRVARFQVLSLAPRFFQLLLAAAAAASPSSAARGLIKTP